MRQKVKYFRWKFFPNTNALTRAVLKIAGGVLQTLNQFLASLDDGGGGGLGIWPLKVKLFIVSVRSELDSLRICFILPPRVGYDTRSNFLAEALSVR